MPLIYDMGDYGTLHATIIYLVACVGGLVLTPVYGRAIKRTKTKWGRYKPYILFLAPVVSILGVFAVWISVASGALMLICLVYAGQKSTPK